VKSLGPVGDIQGQIALKTTFIGGVPGIRMEHTIKPYEWVPLDVTVLGEKVQVHIAGDRTLTTLPGPHKLGPIALWLPKPDSAVELRNIRITNSPLSAGDGPDPAELRKLTGIAGTWESDWGPVTLEHGPIEGWTAVTLGGSYLPEPDRKGVITRGKYNPVLRVVQFAYAEPWWDGTGSAELKLSADGNKLEGIWSDSSGDSGIWTLVRRPETKRKVLSGNIPLPPVAPLDAAQTAPKPESAQPKFQGLWQFYGVEQNGSKLTQEKLTDCKWEFDGDKYALKFFTTLQEGKVTLDPSKDSRQIDLAVTVGPDSGKSYRGIYKFFDDELILCFPGNTDAERPKTFSGNVGNGQVVYVLKKKKTG
jgi:uncharacterized protein (TIGR03067 family)